MTPESYLDVMATSREYAHAFIEAEVVTLLMTAAMLVLGIITLTNLSARNKAAVCALVVLLAMLTIGRQIKEIVRKQTVREKLAAHMREGAILWLSCADEYKPPPIREVQAWIDSAQTCVRVHISPASAVALISPMGLPPVTPHNYRIDEEEHRIHAERVTVVIMRLTEIIARV